jgi:hypothetical protein
MTAALPPPAGPPTTPAEPPRSPAEIDGDGPGGLTHPDGRLPVPYRITVALGNRYGPQVDRALGGREPMVDQWEAGVLVPTPWQVRLLADYTRYPLDWFYDPAPPAVTAGMICYRRKVDGRRCHPIVERPAAPPAQAEGVLF